MLASAGAAQECLSRYQPSLPSSPSSNMVCICIFVCICEYFCICILSSDMLKERQLSVLALSSLILVEPWKASAHDHIGCSTKTSQSASSSNCPKSSSSDQGENEERRVSIKIKRTIESQSFFSSSSNCAFWYLLYFNA